MITVFNKMQYKFKNKIIFKILKKLIIMAKNLLIYYLIVNVSYIKVLLIIKLIFRSIKLKILKEISYIYNSQAKFKKIIRFNKHIFRQFKN